MFLWWVFWGFIKDRGRLELRGHAQVAHTQVAFRRAEQKEVGSLRVILHMCYYLTQLVNVLWLQIDYIKSYLVVLEAPHVYAEVVCWKEGLAIGAGAYWINVKVVAILILLIATPFDAGACYSGLWQLELSINNWSLTFLLSLHVVSQFP